MLRSEDEGDIRLGNIIKTLKTSPDGLCSRFAIRVSVEIAAKRRNHDHSLPKRRQDGRNSRRLIDKADQGFPGRVVEVDCTGHVGSLPAEPGKMMNSP